MNCGIVHNCVTVRSWVSKKNWEKVWSAPLISQMNGEKGKDLLGSDSYRSSNPRGNEPRQSIREITFVYTVFCHTNQSSHYSLTLAMTAHTTSSISHPFCTRFIWRDRGPRLFHLTSNNTSSQFAPFAKSPVFLDAKTQCKLAQFVNCVSYIFEHTYSNKNVKAVKLDYLYGLWRCP